ncbi:MAG: SRPBCC family protein [Rubrobacter sp.]
MKINNEFTVSAPVEEAWKAMLDLESIAPCLPGASITEQDDNDQYQGTMTVKIGPITAKYKGTVKYEEKDESAHRAVLHATGRDARGQGTASATITSHMEEVSGGTKVSVETDMKLTGKAAQFGRGIAQDVAEKMLGQFAQCLEQRLGSDSGDGSSDGSYEAGATEAAAGPTATASAEDNGTASAPSASAAATSGGTVTPGGAPAGAASGSMATPVTGAGSMAQPVMKSNSSGSAAASTEASDSKEKPKARKISQPDPEPLDLGEMSQDALLKRAKPVLVGVGALLAVLLIWRGLRGGKKN